MEILADRIGVLLKYGKVMGSLTKRFFFIDNDGTLYYTEKESPISNLLKMEKYDNKELIEIIKPISKQIKLNECTVSSIKPYLENKFELQGRSYFELYLKVRDFRSILIFGWQEEYTGVLHEYISTFRDINNTNISNIEHEKELKTFSNFEGIIDNDNDNNDIFMESGNSIKQSENSEEKKYEKKSSKSHNIHAKDKKYIESLLSKLNGKFVNQNDWHKERIRVVNPTSDLNEYEEAWVELENGSNYSGPVKNGMPHGFGKEYRKDGCLYTGYFFEGKWQGPGTLTNETLDTFQGEFIDGCISGI
jgi:hypothetical protein